MRRSARVVVTAAVVTAVGLAGSTASAVAEVPASPDPAAPGALTDGLNPLSAQVFDLVAAPLRGYQLAQSAQVTDSGNIQSEATAICPTGTTVLGGGALINGSSLAENVNSSFPPSTDGRSWTVTVTNASDTAGTFQAYAICAKRPKSYAIITGVDVDNPAGGQTTTSVDCPTGTVPLGGGAYAASPSVAVNLSSSLPTKTGWRATVNNASADDSTVFGVVICATAPTGYKQVASVATRINAHALGFAQAACPAGRTAIGGGASTTSVSTSVNLNTTYPPDTVSWRSYESNSSTRKPTLRAYAICANTV